MPETTIDALLGVAPGASGEPAAAAGASAGAPAAPAAAAAPKAGRTAQLEEEVRSLREAVEREKLEAMRSRVGQAVGLPLTLHSRLIGTDEESLRADAEELASVLAVGTQPAATTRRAPNTGPRPVPGKPTFRRSQLRDVDFFKHNEKAIREAAREGRIVED